VHAPLPLGRAANSRTHEKRRGATRKELRGEKGKGRERKHQVEPWMNPSRDEERPLREEWSTAMKILTGTVALADRPSRSFYYCFFPLLLSFPPSRSHRYPSPSLRERFTDAAYQPHERLRRRYFIHMRLLVGTRKVLRKSQDAARVDTLACTRLRDKRQGR